MRRYTAQSACNKSHISTNIVGDFTVSAKSNDTLRKRSIRISASDTKDKRTHSFDISMSSQSYCRY